RSRHSSSRRDSAVSMTAVSMPTRRRGYACLAETADQAWHPSGMKTAIDLSPSRRAVSWLLQLVAAAILLQTLFFKFTGAEESVYIFSTLGAEPAGRIGSGVLELVASVLLLVPPT